MSPEPRRYLIERWFHIGYGARLLYQRTSAKVEVGNAVARVTDIDTYARTGKTSGYLRDLSRNGYRRLADRNALSA